MADADEPPLRFGLGARVSCNMGREGWANGSVVALRYREAQPATARHFQDPRP